MKNKTDLYNHIKKSHLKLYSTKTEKVKIEDVDNQCKVLRVFKHEEELKNIDETNKEYETMESYVEQTSEDETKQVYCQVRVQ